MISQSQQVHFLTQVNAPAYAQGDERARAAFLNTDSQLLEQLLPPDMYAQFQDLNNRYGGSSLVPQMYRPIAAMDWLRQAAMQRLRLTSDRAISVAVYALAQKYEVPTFGVKMKRDAVWDEMIERIGKTPRVMDVPCAAERMERLEKDLQESVARANAWATGDIATLRADAGLLAAGTPGKVCAAYFKDINVGVVQQRALRRYSYSAARKWLKENRSTVVLVPITTLFEKDGLIQKLRRAGYKVQEPESLSDAGQKK